MAWREARQLRRLAFWPAAGAGSCCGSCDKTSLFTTEGSSYEWNADLNGQRIDETTTTNVMITITITDDHTGQAALNHRDASMPASQG
jgi:hypothetical protein